MSFQEDNEKILQVTGNNSSGNAMSCSPVLVYSKIDQRFGAPNLPKAAEEENDNDSDNEEKYEMKGYPANTSSSSSSRLAATSSPTMAVDHSQNGHSNQLLNECRQQLAHVHVSVQSSSGKQTAQSSPSNDAMTLHTPTLPIRNMNLTSDEKQLPQETVHQSLTANSEFNNAMLIATNSPSIPVTTLSQKTASNVRHHHQQPSYDSSVLVSDRERHEKESEKKLKTSDNSSTTSHVTVPVAASSSAAEKRRKDVNDRYQSPEKKVKDNTENGTRRTTKHESNSSTSATASSSTTAMQSTTNANTQTTANTQHNHSSNTSAIPQTNGTVSNTDSSTLTTTTTVPQPAAATNASSSSSSSSSSSASQSSAPLVDTLSNCSNAANPREAVVSVISCVLHQLFGNGANDRLPSDPAMITMFHTAVPPAISISAYFERLARYTEASSEVLIQSLIHINRILHTRPNFQINSLNIHRLLLTSVLCSAKFFDDHYFNNAYYAKVGGVPNLELNWLEVEFLSLINFDLFVKANAYRHFYNELCNPHLHAHCRCSHRFMPVLPMDIDLGDLDIIQYETDIFRMAQQAAAAAIAAAAAAGPVTITTPTSSTSTPDSHASNSHSRSHSSLGQDAKTPSGASSVNSSAATTPRSITGSAANSGLLNSTSSASSSSSTSASSSSSTSTLSCTAGSKRAADGGRETPSPKHANHSRTRSKSKTTHTACASAKTQKATSATRAAVSLVSAPTSALTSSVAIAQTGRGAEQAVLDSQLCAPVGDCMNTISPPPKSRSVPQSHTEPRPLAAHGNTAFQSATFPPPPMFQSPQKLVDDFSAQMQAQAAQMQMQMQMQNGAFMVPFPVAVPINLAFNMNVYLHPPPPFPAPGPLPSNNVVAALNTNPPAAAGAHNQLPIIPQQHAASAPPAISPVPIGVQTSTPPASASSSPSPSLIAPSSSSSSPTPISSSLEDTQMQSDASASNSGVMSCSNHTRRMSFSSMNPAANNFRVSSMDALSTVAADLAPLKAVESAQPAVIASV